MEKLAIRLGSTPADPVHWLVWSDTEEEIIASGELPNIDGLSQLKDRAPNAKVVGIVPGCDLVLKNVQLPLKANRKVLNAVPYMIEEEVASDISKAFFAFGKRIGDLQQVAIVSREKLSFWQQTFKQAELFCDLMVPDMLALPFTSGSISVLSVGHDNTAPFIIRANEWEAYQGEYSWTFPLLEKLVKETPQESALQSITTYSEIADLERLKGEEETAEPNNIKVVENYDYLPMQILLEGALRSDFNLLQGEFAVKPKKSMQWEKWRLVAVLAAVALCANLISKTVELSSLKSQRQATEAQLQASIEKGFPNLPRSRDKRAAIEREMARLSQSGGGISMLVMLTQMGPSFANTGVAPQSIRYDAGRTELRMQSVASNFESLEKFRREVQALGFEVDQGAINNQGDQVVGTIIIKG